MERMSAMGILSVSSYLENAIPLKQLVDPTMTIVIFLVSGN